MRITIVQGAFLPVPPLLGGAVEKVWFGLAMEFAKHGHAVTHISRRYPDLPDDESRDGVHYLRVRGESATRSQVLMKMRDLRYSLRARRAIPKSDIVVTNTFWLPALLHGAAQGKVYVHAQRYPKGQYFLYRGAARIQTVSKVIRDAIRREAPYFSDRLKVIPNPLPSDFQIARTPKKRLDQPINLLFVGRIHPEKGLDILLLAFNRLLQKHRDRFRLVIVGPHEIEQGGGGGEFLNQLEAKAIAVSDRIQWMGPVFDTKELMQYYDEAMFLLYPSTAAKGEASPLTPVEAMARGCIPIVSDLGCFSDYLIPDRNGFVFSRGKCTIEGAQNLAAAIEKAASPCVHLSDIRESAVESSISYTPDVVAEQYLDDFAQILSNE